MQIRHDISAPPQQVWNVLIDTRQWPVWGPSVRAVKSPRQYIDAGLKGRLQTVIGLWIPFEITDFEPLHFWSWKVAGIPATGHRLEIIDDNRCELIFEMPAFALPYALLCARRPGALAVWHRAKEVNLMNLSHKKGVAALKNMFVADALAMPVHWFYNPADIEKAFPGGISRLEAAPAVHPSSIMSLHSTNAGGRGVQEKNRQNREIVGDVILRGKRPFWGQPHQHYHQGMQAGENTLNAHCARVLMRSLTATSGRYDKQRFVDDYIDFMTAYPPRHPDAYAESYHRGFFANLESGKPGELCAATTHDTPSIGGLVTIAPIVFSERLQGLLLDAVKEHCRQHLYLTHPDKMLARVCADYVQLLNDLLFRDPHQDGAEILAQRPLPGVQICCRPPKGSAGEYQPGW